MLFLCIFSFSLATVIVEIVRRKVCACWPFLTQITANFACSGFQKTLLDVDIMFYFIYLTTENGTLSTLEREQRMEEIFLHV